MNIQRKTAEIFL